MKSVSPSLLAAYVDRLVGERNLGKLRELGTVLLRSCYIPLNLPEREARPLSAQTVVLREPGADQAVRTLCARLLRNGRVPRNEFPNELKPELEWRLRSLGVVLYRTRRNWRIAWDRNGPVAKTGCAPHPQRDDEN